MALSDLTEQQLNAFIRNYEGQGKSEGGKFSLSELRLEKLRRLKSPFLPRETAATIVRLAHSAPDGLVSYKAIWEVFRPNGVWTGNAPRAEMAKALASVIAYCVDNKLPILTTLVVRADSRSHSDDAVANIFNEAKALGVDVGLEPHAFVRREQEASRALSTEFFEQR